MDVQPPPVPNLPFLARCMKKISEEFFRVPLRGGNITKALERPYAYELYRHIRDAGQDIQGLRVLPELGKFYLDIPVIPDLLLFDPIQHYMAIEIKPALAIGCLRKEHALAIGQNGIPVTHKDIHTLRLLRDVLQYEQSVVIVFGDRRARFPHRAWHEERLQDFPWLTVWWHRRQDEIVDIATGEVI